MIPIHGFARGRQYYCGWRLETRCLGVVLVKVREGWLVWGWIGLFLQAFSCRELLFYGAVARLHLG
jgi:hypothetical protein